MNKAPCPFKRLVVLLYPLPIFHQHRALAHSIIQAQTPINRTEQHSSLPYPGAIVGQNNAGYSPPAPPPATYYGPSSGRGQQQAIPYNHPIPAQHPDMLYAVPPQPQHVFLGSVSDWSRSKPVYGPPGADFDRLGNVYIPHSDGSKEWIGPYRDTWGNITKNPNQRVEEDCCYQICGINRLYNYPHFKPR